MVFRASATHQSHYRRGSASLRKSPTISLDFRTHRQTYTPLLSSLSRGVDFVPNDCLKNARRRVPLVLGLSADVKNRRTKILTCRDLSNSPLLSPSPAAGGGQRSHPLPIPLLPSWFLSCLDINIINIRNIKTDERKE